MSSEQYSESSESVPNLGTPPTPLSDLWDCEADACTANCSEVFERVKVYPIIRGGTRVEWKIADTFRDADPHEFRLQVGHTANPDADDWEWVGLSARDAWYMIDDTQRVWGKTQWTHYRVALATPNGVYFSPPERAMGASDHRSWNLAKALIRAQKVRLQGAGVGTKGYLLKRKLYGTPCTTCTDFQTGEVLDAKCAVCYGTGIVGGYFPAMPCIYADLGNRRSREHIDPNGRGTANDMKRVRAELIGVPHIMQYDVWVNADNDERWIIHSTENLEEMGNIPVLVAAEFRLAPFSDIVYDVPVVPGDSIE